MISDSELSFISDHQSAFTGEERTNRNESPVCMHKLKTECHATRFCFGHTSSALRTSVLQTAQDKRPGTSRLRQVLEAQKHIRHSQHSGHVHIPSRMLFLLFLDGRFRHSSMARPHVEQFGYSHARQRYLSRPSLDFGARCEFNKTWGRTPQEVHLGYWHARQRAPHLAVLWCLCAIFFCEAMLKAANGKRSRQTLQVCVLPCQRAGSCVGWQWRHTASWSLSSCCKIFSVRV